MIANRGTIRPDAAVRGRRFATPSTSCGRAAARCPDNERILRTLRKAHPAACTPRTARSQLEERLHIGEGLVKTIFIHAFMDEHTFEVDRIKKCCTHYALPDGRLMPGCAYNMFYRHKDPRFTGAGGHADDLGQGVSRRHARLLAGKTALITGGSRGLGRALVETFAAEGARVAFSYARDEAGARRDDRGRCAERAAIVPRLCARRAGNRSDVARARAGLGRARHRSSTTPASARTCRSRSWRRRTGTA